MKHPSKSLAKRRAWKAFSKYIRTRDMNLSGFVKCYTCGRKFDFKNIQAGHGLGGRHGGVLFLEELVKPQCRGCNIFGGGKYPIFTQKLIEEHGTEKYYELVKKSNQLVKYSIEDYLEIERRYKELLLTIA